MNVTEKLRLSYILIGLGLGALSGFIAGLAETFYTGYAVALYFLHPSIFVIFVVSVIAPFVEEQIKPLGLYFLKEEEVVSLSVRDWTILGSFAGLGFSLLENGLYAYQVSNYGSGVILALLGLRTLVDLPVHMIATSVTGFGIGLWARTGKVSYFLRFLAVAMLIHGCYNFAATMVG
jgi:RsiW-degrading membrane proteinase PrsW (M82 family)